jgi:glucose-6-phosphate isomerase
VKQTKESTMYKMSYKWEHGLGKTGTNITKVLNKAEGLELLSKWNQQGNNESAEKRWTYRLIEFIPIGHKEYAEK